MARTDYLYQPDVQEDVVRAGEKIDRLCRKYGLVKARLARAVGLHPGSFQYYVTEFQGEYIPLEKPWREPLRKELLKGGATSTEVAELFGQAFSGP